MEKIQFYGPTPCPFCGTAYGGNNNGFSQYQCGTFKISNDYYHRTNMCYELQILELKKELATHKPPEKNLFDEPWKCSCGAKATWASVANNHMIYRCEHCKPKERTD